MQDIDYTSSNNREYNISNSSTNVDELHDVIKHDFDYLNDNSSSQYGSINQEDNINEISDIIDICAIQ